VNDPVALLGVAMTVGGAIVGIASAGRSRGRIAAGLLVAVAVLPLGFVVWLLWQLAHEAT
jgi:hypothetical protein